MTPDDWADRLRAHYFEAVARGEHDDDCERRERMSICHCAKRKRIADGLIEPPFLYAQMPYCGECLTDVDHDGDQFRCPKCSATWQDVETTGEWDDDYGDITTDAERFGPRLIEEAR